MKSRLVTKSLSQEGAGRVDLNKPTSQGKGGRCIGRMPEHHIWERQFTSNGGVPKGDNRHLTSRREDGPPYAQVGLQRHVLEPIESERFVGILVMRPESASQEMSMRG